MLLALSIVLQPAAYGVGLGSAVVDAGVFLDGAFELFFHLVLRLAKNILDDGFPRLWIVADGVSSLPSAILSLSNVPPLRLLVALA